jgi:hypothetical protein
MHIAFPRITVLSHGTHHFPRISHYAHLSVGVNIFTSPKTKSEFMQPSKSYEKTAPPFNQKHTFIKIVSFPVLSAHPNFQWQIYVL